MQMNYSDKIFIKIGRKITIFGLFLLFLTGIGGCRFLPKESEEEIPALLQPNEEEVTTHTVEEGAIEEEITSSATVGSSLEKILYFLIPGRVFDIKADIGDMVKKDQELVSLDTSDLEYGLKLAKINLDQELLRFEQQYGDKNGISNDLQAAWLNTASAKLDLDQAKDRLKNEGRLLDGLQKKSAERNVERMEIFYAQSKMNLDKLKIQTTENSLPCRIAVMSVDRARLEYERLMQQYERSILKAPFDGKIIEQRAVRGKYTDAYSFIISIASMKGLELKSEIDSSTVKLLSPGIAVRIDIEDNRVEKGHIVSINAPDNPFLNKDCYYVSIRMDNPGLKLEMGKYYIVHYITRAVKKTLLVPNDAVREDADGNKYLRVIEGKQRHDVYIKTGIRSETMTQVKEGAVNGMTVVGR